MTVHYQEHLLIPINDSVGSGKTGSKRNICCIFDCIRFVYKRSNGLCKLHDRRYEKGTDLLYPDKGSFNLFRCQGKNCTIKPVALGLCWKHYKRKLRNGDPNIVKLIHDRRCSIPLCYNEHYGLSFCRKHHAKYRKYGDPLFKKRQDYIRM